MGLNNQLISLLDEQCGCMFVRGGCLEAKIFKSSALVPCWVSVKCVCSDAKTSAAAGKQLWCKVSQQHKRACFQESVRGDSGSGPASSKGKPRCCYRSEKTTSSTQRIKIAWKKNDMHRRMGSGEHTRGGATFVEIPNSCNMEELIIAVAISKWVLFSERRERRALAVH